MIERSTPLNISAFDNETCEEDVLLFPRDVHAQMKKAFEVTLLVLLVGVMVAMGCLITLDQMKTILRRPWALLIGMGCQFILLPLLAFGMAHAAQLAPFTAQGLLILATCPGGSLSNIFTHWVDGDVTLSVCMTIVSTVMAFGMMPLNLWIYTRSWSSTAANIPYVNIVIMLASVIGPVSVGMFFRWKLPKVAAFVVKVGSILGIATIVVNEVALSLLFHGVFRSHWTVWLCAASFPCVGLALAYLLAFIFRQTSPRCRTIALETCTQNVPLCLTLIMVTFPMDVIRKISVIPVLFTMFYLAEMSAIIAVYVLRKKVCLQASGASDNEKAVRMPLRDDVM